MRYRHEYKYYMDAMEEQLIKIRLDAILERDCNVQENGMYTIRSLYFDDIKDSCFYENENGVDPRAKYRIRIYNCDTSRITLEKKIKNKGMTLKESCSISMDECELFMKGVIPNSDKKLILEMRNKKMLPKVIVTYNRIPYVHTTGNVRVTIDKDITSSSQVDRFLELDYLQRPIMAKGQSILEVKWDEVLPSYIKNTIQLDSLQWTAFSKYYNCRRYCN